MGSIYDFDAMRKDGYSNTDILNALHGEFSAKYDVDAMRNDGHSDDNILKAIAPDYTQQPELEPQKESGDFMRGAGEAFQQVPQLGYGLLAGAGAIAEKVVGEGGIATSIKEKGVEGFQRWGEKVAEGSKESDSWSTSYERAKEGDFGSLVDWFQHGLGYASAQGVQILATGGVGALGAKAAGVGASKLAAGMVAKESAKIAATSEGAAMAAEQIAKIATANVASKIGQNTALAATAFGMEGGEIYGDLVSTAQKEGRDLTGSELGKAFVSTIGAGGLEFVGDRIGLDLMLGKKVAGIGGVGGRAARATAGGAVGLIGEGLTEYAQTGIEEYGKGKEANILPFMQSEAAQRQAIDAAALGGLGGTAMGGVGGALSKPQPKTPTPTDILAAPDVDTAIQSFTDSLDGAGLLDEGNTQTPPTQREFGALSQGTTGFGQVNELADLVEQEQADLAQRRGGLIDAQQQDNALRMESGIESTDARVANTQAEETRAARLQLLDGIYANPKERSPGMTFLAQLEANFPHNPNPTAEEKRIIANRESAHQAFNTTAPVEVAPAEVTPEQAKPNVPRTQEAQIAQVEEYLAKGYAPISGGRMLSNAKGKKLLLTATQREHVKNRPIQEAQNGAILSGAAANTTANLRTDVPADVEVRGTAGTGGGTMPDMGRVDLVDNQLAAGSAQRDSDAASADAPIPVGAGGAAVVGYNTPAVSNTIAPDSSQPTVNSDLASTIKPAVEQLIKRKAAAGQIRMGTHLAIAINKAKAAIESGTGKAADFVKAAKQFKGKDDQIHTTLLSIANALEPVKNAKKKPQKASSDLLQRIKQLGGIDGTLALDITGEQRAPAGWKFAFKKGGTGLDDLATMLANDGFMIDTGDVDGGVQQLRDMIRSHIGGERSFKAVSIEAAAEKESASRDMDAMAQRAGELGINWRNLSAQQLSDAVYEAEDALEMERLDAADNDEEVSTLSDSAIDDEIDIPFNIDGTVDNAALASWLGEDDGQEGVAGTVQGVVAEGQEVGVGGNGGTDRQEAGTGQEVLQSYTAAEVAQREAAQAAQERAQRAEEEGAKAEQAKKDQAAVDAKIKARADNPDNFQFGESSKQAAAPVADLFNQPDKPAATQFIKSPDGSIDFGEITPDMAEVMRRQAGKVRLEVGDADYGLTHIEQRHGAQIRGMGFKSVAEFVADAVKHIESIWSPHKTSQMVMIQAHEKGKAVFIQLKPSESGDFYTINTAFPVSEGYAEQKKWEMLWSGESVPTVASGATSFADPARKAGEQVAMTSSQSSDGNIPQPAAESKQAPEQQATAILDRANVTGKDRLDVMAAFLEEKKGYSLDDLERAYPAKKESAIDTALRSVGIDPNAPPDKAKALRREADKLMKESGKMLDGIPAGQPIHSTRDRNLRDKSIEKARKASELYAQAEELEAANPATSEQPAKPQGKIEDFGEKIGGAKKDKAAALREAVSRELSDEDIASMPLSKIWPKESIDQIEDPFIAAVATAARAEVPAKPKVGYKVKAWVEKVKFMRGLVSMMIDGKVTKERFTEELKKYRNLEHFAEKVELLEQIDRTSWDRIGRVEANPNAYRYEPSEFGASKQVAAPIVRVEIDGRNHYFQVASVADVVADVQEKMGIEVAAKKMEFEVRGREGAYFINKKGDSLYRRLKTFTTSKEALDYRASNYADLVAAWEAVKASDNVKEDDVRGKENRPRSSEDWRKGKDVTPEQFASDLGFRAVEFGNWVGQGKSVKERQGMLNEAYDAFMDLASIIGVPPKAISLNGSLGLGFGSRGSGKASAHFEPDMLVINLTKTRGAGTLAHEWFHALDNYFQRERIANGETSQRLEGGHSGDFITYAPENYYVNKRTGQRMPARDFALAQPGHVGDISGTEQERKVAKMRRMVGDPAQWELKEGVRPEVGEAFADMVKALNESPMAKRASLIDKGKSGGYWSRIIERGARSFENYVIHKMMLKGYHNDYLANVTPASDFVRDAGRYPYLLEGEIAPVAEAFDNLFATIQTKETDKGVALFSQKQSRADMPPVEQSVIDGLISRIDGVRQAAGDARITAVFAPSELPAEVLKQAELQGVPQNEIHGVLHNGRAYIVRQNLKTEQDVEEVLLHEVLGHGGVHALLGDTREGVLLESFDRAGGISGIRMIALRHGVLKELNQRIPKGKLDAGQKIAVVDEMLALAQGKNHKLRQAALEWWNKVRNHLIAALNKLGMTGTATKLDKFDAGETAVMLRQMREAVIEGGDIGGKGVSFMVAQQPIPGTAQPPAQPPRQGNIPLQGGQPGNRASWDSPEASKLDNVIYTLQDKHIDMKRVVEAIKEAGGNLVEKFNPYLAEELFHGRAAKRTQDFVNTELKPLIAELRMRGLDIDTLDQYLHARHAKEANALIAQRDPNMQDGGSGMTDQEADDYFSGLPADKKMRLDGAAKRVDAIIARTRDLYVSYGLVAKDQADGWAQMFQHYVPLMREDNDGGMGIGQGFSIKGKEVKHRTGSTAKVVDILANIALQREKAITRGEKNRVAVALAGLVKLNPNSEFWTFGKPPTERVLNEKTGLVEERIDPTFKSKPNVVVAKIKDSSGQVHERAVIFNESDERAVRMVEAFKNLDAVQLGGVMGVSAMITRYFASINTQYNPIFGVMNIVRDVQGMALNLGSTPIAQHRSDVIKLIPSAVKGIYQDSRAEREGRSAGSKWAQMWEEMQDEGGMTGYRDLYRNSEDRANSIKHELDPYQWHNNALGKVFTANGALKVPLKIAQNRAGWLFDWLSDYNQTLEGATRLATYKVARDNGMTKQQAASLAKNITVNFNRKGHIGQQAGAMYAFFNAATQGSARIAQTMLTYQDGKVGLTKTGKAIVYGGITLGALQALMLAAAGFDDDEPPEFVRERALIIPIGNKKYLTLPMPLGFHVFPNIGRIPTEWALNGFKDTPERIIHLLGTVVEAFNPLGSAGMSLQIIMPTALDPFTALAENKDWTGKTIYKEDFNSMKPTPGFERNKDTATAWSKGIAEALNYLTGGTDYTPGAISPTADQIDYLIAQVTGGVGRETSKAAQAIGSGFSGEELPPHKMPLVGRFYGDSGAQSSQGNAYYSNLKRINEVDAEIKGRRENREPIDEYKQDNPEWRLIGRAKFADKIISRLRKQKRELIEQDAPKERIKAIEDRITVEMQRLNEAARKLEEKEAA